MAALSSLFALSLTFLTGSWMGLLRALVAGILGGYWSLFLIAVLILLAVFVFASETAVLCLMGYIVLVALYGSITSSPKIILTQGGLAILTLISAALPF